MRTIISAIAVFLSLAIYAQSTTAENIIQGGKTLVELVRVLKTPAYTNYQPQIVEKVDSCTIKNISDLCFKNSGDKTLYISLYKRNGNGYEANVLTITILPKNQECWYEIKGGIYKFKIEKVDEDDDEKRKVYREGEMKLAACAKTVKEIIF